MKCIILLAPPAAGKGTQADFLSKKYGFIHISTGDLIRDAIKKNDEMSIYLTEKIQLGKLVDDEIILKLLDRKIGEYSHISGIVLDGFPRNLDQVEKTKQYSNLVDIQNNACVIYLSIDYEHAFKRIVGRMTCPKCNHVYNSLIIESQPNIENTCNDCGVQLEKRLDDNEETFKIRFETYLTQTQPLIAYYKKQGILYEVDSSLPASEVFKKIESIVDNL